MPASLSVKIVEKSVLNTQNTTRRVRHVPMLAALVLRHVRNLKLRFNYELNLLDIELAICPRGATSWTAPMAIASLGIPNTAEVSLSWAMV